MGFDREEGELRAIVRHQRAITAFSRSLLEGGPHAAESALAHILSTVGAGRAYVFENFTDKESGLWARLTCEAYAPGREPHVANPPSRRISYTGDFLSMHDALSRGDSYQGSALALPPGVRAIGEPPGALSVLHVPVRVGGSWWGFMGLADSVSPREWGEPEKALLCEAAELMSVFLSGRRSHERLESRLATMEGVFKLSSTGMGLTSGRFFLEVNERLCRMVGYPESEIAGRMSRFLYPSDQEWERLTDPKFLEAIMAGVGTIETRWLRKDGQVIDVFLSVSPVDKGARNGFAFSVLDITERKKAEEALRRGEERYRLLFNSTNDIILVHPFHEDGSPEPLVDANDLACARLGYSRKELLGLTTHDIDAPEGPPVMPEAKRGLRARGYAVWEGALRRKDGERIPVEIGNRLFEMDGQSMILATIRDLSERKSAETALLRSREMLYALLNATTDVAFLTEADGRLLACNEAFLKELGVAAQEEVIGRTLWSLSSTLFDAGIRNRMQEVLVTAAASRMDIEAEGRIRDFSVFPVLDRDGAARLLAFFIRDITESRRMEEQLRQALKMEAIGRLAGGVAHDFNNLLTVISGYSSLVLERMLPESALRAEVMEINDAARRAAALTARLLAFSRKQVLDPRVVSINELVRGIEKMLKRMIGEDIDVAILLDDATGDIRADSGQIEQVLMNLAVNARDAMPAGGTLTVETADDSVDDEATAALPGMRPGRYVRLAVRDTGRGMDRSVLTHIFEPFFTTKAQGKGTGLGLSTVYGIVKQSDGFIYCQSELGKGTSFTLYFPRVAGDDRLREERPGAPSLVGGRETLLLVEDEDSVRAFAARVLETAGYTVKAAASGGEAMEALRSGPRPELLITDVVMKGMNGSELARQARALSPAIRLLFISGYSDEAIEKHGSLLEDSSFLQKPFDASRLLFAVRNILDRVS